MAAWSTPKQGAATFLSPHDELHFRGRNPLRQGFASQDAAAPCRRPARTSAAILAATLLALVSGCTGQPPPPDAGPPRVAAQGFVEPAGDVHRLAFLRDGVIKQLLVRAGDMVERGQVLARQDDRLVRAQLLEAEAELARAEAKLAQVKAGKSDEEIAAQAALHDLARCDAALAKEEHERHRALKSAGAVTDSEADRRAAEHAAADARVASARAQLDHVRGFVRPTDVAVAEREGDGAAARVESARAALSERELAAPVAGTVLEIIKREGEAAGPLTAEPVLLLADLSRLRVRAEVEELSALKVRSGAPCRVWLPGADESVTGVVEEVRSAMGRKTVFARSARERRDLDTRDVLIGLTATGLPVGLRVEVEVGTR